MNAVASSTTHLDLRKYCLQGKDIMAFPTASAEHARKRQYQIHSFFQRNASTIASSGSSSPSHSISPLLPPLPAETQSSLLSVGMRVRKSVPEGYKTHKQCRQKLSRSLALLPLSSNRLPDRLTTLPTLANSRRSMDFTRLEATPRKALSLHPPQHRQRSTLGMKAQLRRLV